MKGFVHSLKKNPHQNEFSLYKENVLYSVIRVFKLYNMDIYVSLNDRKCTLNCISFKSCSCIREQRIYVAVISTNQIIARNINVSSTDL